MKTTKIGKVFNVLGIDKTGEIAIVAYKVEAEKFFDILKVGHKNTSTNKTFFTYVRSKI